MNTTIYWNLAHAMKRKFICIGVTVLRAMIILLGFIDHLSLSLLIQFTYIMRYLILETIYNCVIHYDSVITSDRVILIYTHFLSRDSMTLQDKHIHRFCFNCWYSFLPPVWFTPSQLSFPALAIPRFNKKHFRIVL